MKKGIIKAVVLASLVLFAAGTAWAQATPDQGDVLLPEVRGERYDRALIVTLLTPYLIF